MLGLRIAILGIGNELNGDDAAGLWCARSFAALARCGERFGNKERVLIIEAGPSPESFGGPLRRFAPDLVLLVDAAEMGERLGTIADRLGLGAGAVCLNAQYAAHDSRAIW
jgi:hydrogenase 3 maturation protease